MIRTLDWSFPLTRTHTGIPLGNGRTGLLVRGAGSTLRITVGRADLWDHRGGMPWTARQNYADIRAALEAGDETRISEIFRPGSGTDAAPARPSVLPLGRVEIELDPEWTLESGLLHLPTGTVTVTYGNGRCTHSMEISLHPERDIAWINGTDDVVRVEAVTSWDLMRDRLQALSFEAPLPLADGGWYWPLPADPGVYVAWRTAGSSGDRMQLLAIVTGRSPDAREAQASVTRAFDETDYERGTEERLGWWNRYWRRAARVSVPNPVLQEIHDYGLYLFAGLTAPTGVAATLQGPWIEEYDFPPWSSDYHFNINVQMCYSPALRSGLSDFMRPLFDMVWSWRDQLRANSRHFVGLEDGYMLPHAVDDRCTCMGSFWTGTVDHGCTAWVAGMMYDYADYTGDTAFLREVAFPFMSGAFAVYRAMMEDDGRTLRLPVSVSPEYRGASMNAWGANASFQLAAVHRLAENLVAAAATLAEQEDPAWADVADRLPRACLIGTDGAAGRIALWEGVDLEESHRHHSHLAGIVPFDTIDPLSDEWRTVVDNSLRHWIEEGMGMWSGWCMSWASQLHSRVHNGEGAELLLELWKRVFTNEGRASMHDATTRGVTLMGARPMVAAGTGGPVASDREATTGAILQEAERMQLDGAMGGVAAVQEMLLYSQRGILHLFPAVPTRWTRVSFERMRAPGGLVVSGWYDRSGSWRAEIDAVRACRVRLRPPSTNWMDVTSDPPGERRAEAGSGIFARMLDAGSRVVLESRP